MSEVKSIDQQIEEAKEVIRAGGRVAVQPAPDLLDDFFPQTDVARLEAAIDHLVRLVMIRTMRAERYGSPDSYDRL